MRAVRASPLAEQPPQTAFQHHELPQRAAMLRPARAVVPTGALHFGLKVEVEAIALASA